MKTAFLGLALLLFAIAAGFISQTQAAVPDDQAATYAYRLIILTGSSTNEHQATLNRMGDAGWELVGVESNTAYLKRKIR